MEASIYVKFDKIPLNLGQLSSLLEFNKVTPTAITLLIIVREL